MRVLLVIGLLCKTALSQPAEAKTSGVGGVKLCQELTDCRSCLKRKDCNGYIAFQDIEVCQEEFNPAGSEVQGTILWSATTPEQCKGDNSFTTTTPTTSTTSEDTTLPTTDSTTPSTTPTTVTTTSTIPDTTTPFTTTPTPDTTTTTTAANTTTPTTTTTTTTTNATTTTSTTTTTATTPTTTGTTPSTEVPTTSPASTTAAPAPPTEAPPSGNQFNGWSFFGGILLTVLLLGIGFVGFKYYKLRSATGGSYSSF